MNTLTVLPVGVGDRDLLGHDNIAVALQKDRLVAVIDIGSPRLCGLDVGLRAALSRVRVQLVRGTS